MCKKIFGLVVVIALFGIVVFFHKAILEEAARMTFRKDDLRPADAIVVLAGEPAERVEYGVELFQKGLSRRNMIIMTGGPVVWKYSWAGMMKEHAVSLGVPEGAVLLADRSRSTEEDAVFTKELLVQNEIKSVILVTSPYHSRRAAVIFGRVLGKNYEVISAPVEKSWFGYREWWLRRHERAMILNELSKFLWLTVFGVGTY